MLHKKVKGQSLVEFALVLPILLMLLLGIIEGGRIIWAYVTVQNTAREAARYAVTGRPFACSNDTSESVDYTDYCDDPVEGDPWSTMVLSTTRLAAIKNVAVEHAKYLAVDTFAKSDISEFNDHKDTPGAFGIAVIGQSSVYTQGLGNYAGEPGYDVRVETYYNVEMLDPIYNVLMGGQTIHLSGAVELQNEGADTDTDEYVGGITYETDNCESDNSCSSGSTPYISVQDDYGDYSEPAGNSFSVSVSDHAANTTYKLWFVYSGTDTTFSDSLEFTTDSLGSALLSFVISISAPEGDTKYKIYTAKASDSTNTPVATCLGDSANTPCFSVESGSPTITAKNIDQDNQQAQPISPAAWPISSSIPIYLYGHDTDTSYTITFDGQDSSASPGTLLFDDEIVTQIPTDSDYGSNKDYEPAYYIATGYEPGVSLTIASVNSAGSEVATTTVDLIQASIEVQGEGAVTTTHPQDDLVGLVFRNFAPRQQYQIYIDDGITDAQVERADDDGNISLGYRVPYASHTPGEDPVVVEIYALDYGRGENDYKIASRNIWLYTSLSPYLNVPGGASWPAGSPIDIQVRRHQAETEYALYIQQGEADNPTYSELINTFTTETNTDSLGEYDLGYNIPASFSGSYTLRTFLPADLTTPIAQYEIEVTAEPYITIDDGNRWPPSSDITIRLQQHAANTTYKVWLDKGGDYETYLGKVIMDDTGEGTVDYTIPATMPTRIDGEYYPIYSYLSSALTADNGKLEVLAADLEVTQIEVPDVTFDVEIPITITVANNNAVTITNTYFDADLYIDPDEEPSLDTSLPPGDYKNWIDSVPPSSTVEIADTIVLYGEQIHEIYARADTSDGVSETDETNNMLLKTVDAGCLVEIADEFDDGTVGNAWTQTDFGDSRPNCEAPDDLEDVTSTATSIITQTWKTSGNTQGFTAISNFLGSDSAPSNYTLSSSSSYGNPISSLYVGPAGTTSNVTSEGAYIDFTLSAAANVSISFDYGLYYYNLDSGDWGEYYFLLDGVAYTASSQGTYLAKQAPSSSNSSSYPSSSSSWTNVSRTFSNLSAGSHRLIFGARASALGNGEKVYIYIDNLQVSKIVSAGGTPPSNPTGTLWSAHYDSDAASFSFAKDTFTTPEADRGTDGSTDAESNGSYVTDTGVWESGALQVNLGHTSGQTTSSTNMSGGWSRTFTLSGDNCVTIQGYYRLHYPFDAYDDGEYGEVLLTIDGDEELITTLATTADLSDADQDYDSGWVPFNLTIPAAKLNALSGHPTHTLTLGGFNSGATASSATMEIWFDDIYVVEGASGTATSSQAESGGVLTLTNIGTSALTSDDNDDRAGYHLMHQTVGSGPFEVYVRVNQAPANSSSGLAGLEIRSDELNGASDKLMFGYRSDGKLKVYSRDGSIVEQKSLSSVSVPVWLKISRNGDTFEFDYAVSSSDTVPTDWTTLYTLENFTMPDSVEVGLINAPASSSTLYNATFKHFHICATSAPGYTASSGQGYLGTQCGQVEEDGNGLVIIDAVNTITNQSNGGSWDTVTVEDIFGESSLDGLESTASRPHATYQVNMESSGTFYIWVAGWAEESGNLGVDVGAFGEEIGDSLTSFPTGSSSPGWEQLSGSLEVTPGIYTFDLWANDSNIQVFKILLTSDPDFIPPSDGMAQSACSIIVEESRAPLEEECTDLLEYGDFEGAYAEIYTVWGTSGLAGAYSSVSHAGNRGAAFPTFNGRTPALYQTVTLPTWILSNTTAVLNLWKGVDFDSGGTSAATDALYFGLRRTSDEFDLIDPILLADGGEDANIPDLDSSDPSPDDYLEFEQDIFAETNPLSVLEGGETVEAYFFSPEAGQGTAFYLDDITLTICTTEPEPEQDAALGKISGKTLQGSTTLVGTTVWAYAYADDDSEPGPVSKTYSIQDGTYRFYNLQPGKYLVYAEITTSGGTYYDVRLIEVKAGSEVKNVVLNLQTS